MSDPYIRLPRFLGLLVADSMVIRKDGCYNVFCIGSRLQPASSQGSRGLPDWSSSGLPWFYPGFHSHILYKSPCSSIQEIWWPPGNVSRWFVPTYAGPDQSQPFAGFYAAWLAPLPEGFSGSAWLDESPSVCPLTADSNGWTSFRSFRISALSATYWW